MGSLRYVTITDSAREKGMHYTLSVSSLETEHLLLYKPFISPRKPYLLIKDT